MGSLKRKSPEEPPPPSQREEHVCVHDVSYPRGYVHTSSSDETKKEPANKFPFTLDPFQSQAINCLENSESVMVSTTHTIFYLSLLIFIVLLNFCYNENVVLVEKEMIETQLRWFGRVARGDFFDLEKFCSANATGIMNS